jgi:N-acyl-D-amino-acid deacylase
MYRMGELPDYEPDPATSCAAVAAARGVTAEDVAYDFLLEEEGRAKLLVASSNYIDRNLDSTLEVLRRDDAVLALGDGGAHYGVICDASYTTTTLTHWVRDRARGERLELSEAVNLLTDRPARLHRFRDRGRIAPGLKADLNIIDMDRLKLFSPCIVHDLPGGGKRLNQEAEGYVATFVSGVAIQRDGQDTGARPGRLVRDAGI